MLSEWFIVPATSDRMRLSPGEIPRTIPVRFIHHDQQNCLQPKLP